MIVPPELDQSLFVDQHHDQDQLLVVLGNGFDLFHGFKSRYQDFWQHVGTTPLDEIVHFNRRARSQQVRWSDVEAQIRVAAENAYQLSATRKMPGAGVMVQQRSTRAIRRFEHEFSRYLRTERERVLVSDPTRSQTAREFLSQAGAVLNFNYTDTAQQLYDVWPENIYYLHGSLLEGQTILGVDNDDVLAREPYEYASTTKGYRRDILDFKRWAWQQNGWQPLTEKHWLPLETMMPIIMAGGACIQSLAIKRLSRCSIRLTAICPLPAAILQPAFLSSGKRGASG
ncbi:hypothetical protein LX03_08735 [Limosilactobacillus mucosae]|uniref:Bacteriophage abortive infection AbiH n=1 Tax=Limosilactobacillus mucosae TaxID=97478 RepID=A0A099Y870_LIMMU|nr:hypothetical protein LX03_08735 [Limosilactobacillus mucosae]